jgi:hypothetical protein
MKSSTGPPTAPLAHSLRGIAPVPEWPKTDADQRVDRDDLFDRLHKAWRESAEVSAHDTRSFVERHLVTAMPRGWIANYRIAREAQHFPTAALAFVHYEWRIFREAEPPDGEEFQHYLAFLNARDQLVFVYGNTDAGAGGPHVYWQRSISIPLMNLGLVLPFVCARPWEFPPNQFGLT